jgi:hypothetical protein
LGKKKNNIKMMEIYGPKFYIEYELGDVKFFLFDENHASPVHKKENEGEKTFTEFLKNLIVNNQDKFYDVYTEIGYKKESEIKYGSRSFMLRSIYKEFHNCLKIRKNCQYKNLRMHYCDFRKYYGKFFGDYEYKQVYKYLIKKDYILDELNLERYESFHDRYKYYEKHFQFIKEMIKTNEILQKELSKSIFSKEIIEFIHNNMNKERIEFFRFTVRHHKLFRKMIIRKSKYPLLIKFYTHYVSLYSCLMDVYTLARMFKIFSSPIGDDIAENILFYGGAHHAKKYGEFLEFIGAKKIIEINSTENFISFTKEDMEKSYLFV